MNSKEWQITGNTPLALILAPNDLLEKIDYLRHVDTLLSVAPKPNSLDDLYRHNLYESWVIFLWGYLEFITDQTCDEITELLNQEIRYSDIKGRTIFESVSKYLKLIAKETFPSKELSGRLDAYRRIRNLCVHSSGRRIEQKNDALDKEQARLIKLGGGFKVENKPDRHALEKTPGIVVHDGTYRLTLDFCNAMIDFAVDYVIEFQTVANSIGGRKALFTNE